MNQRDPRLPSAEGLLVVGKDVPRTDAVPKVTGAAQYVADMHLPGMLHAAVLRSPHPNARIVSIDASAAEAMPGVKAVVTGADTARRKWGAFRPDLYPLAIGRVRYVGDPVAMVIAALIAMGIDKGFYAPLRARGARPVTLLIASIGVTMMIQGLIRLFGGASGSGEAPW